MSRRVLALVDSTWRVIYWRSRSVWEMSSINFNLAPLALITPPPPCLCVTPENAGVRLPSETASKNRSWSILNLGFDECLGGSWELWLLNVQYINVIDFESLLLYEEKLWNHTGMMAIICASETLCRTVAHILCEQAVRNLPVRTIKAVPWNSPVGCNRQNKDNGAFCLMPKWMERRRKCV